MNGEEEDRTRTEGCHEVKTDLRVNLRREEALSDYGVLRRAIQSRVFTASSMF